MASLERGRVFGNKSIQTYYILKFTKSLHNTQDFIHLNIYYKKNKERKRCTIKFTILSN